MINTETIGEIFNRAKAEVAKVIIGQEQVVEQCLIAIATGHHALLEGVPGVAKTLLVRTLARVLGCEFNRVQFTPDLMPADITGTSIFNLKTGDFQLVRGPIFTAFLLADEVNRAPAKTQSALLQAMQERKVSIDRETHDLPAEFTVFATQNPVEYEGTYPLPEAQKDRFMLRIDVAPPSREDELILAKRVLGADAPERIFAGNQVQPVLTREDLLTVRSGLEAVTVREDLVAYVVDVVRATRGSEMVLVGGGPRATQALLLASRAHAAMRGRDFVVPDDVRFLAPPVLGHRLVLRPEHEIEGVTIAEVIEQILQKVPVPR
jgi:MoxR-like ATPase